MSRNEPTRRVFQGHQVAWLPDELTRQLLWQKDYISSLPHLQKQGVFYK